MCVCVPAQPINCTRSFWLRLLLLSSTPFTLSSFFFQFHTWSLLFLDFKTTWYHLIFWIQWIAYNYFWNHNMVCRPCKKIPLRPIQRVSHTINTFLKLKNYRKGKGEKLKIKKVYERTIAHCFSKQYFVLKMDITVWIILPNMFWKKRSLNNLHKNKLQFQFMSRARRLLTNKKQYLLYSFWKKF